MGATLPGSTGSSVASPHRASRVVFGAWDVGAASAADDEAAVQTYISES